MMKERNEIIDKSFEFSIRIVKLYCFLKDNKHEFVLSKQLLRSGTSIGANVNEAQAAQINGRLYIKAFYCKQRSERNKILD